MFFDSFQRAPIEGVFLLRLRFRLGGMVSHAVVWYMFDVVDHKNMLIGPGNN